LSQPNARRDAGKAQQNAEADELLRPAGLMTWLAHEVHFTISDRLASSHRQLGIALRKLSRRRDWRAGDAPVCLAVDFRVPAWIFDRCQPFIPKP
jgi:hypothetical protein